MEDDTYRVVRGGIGWDFQLTELVGTKAWCERQAQILRERWKHASNLPPAFDVMQIDEARKAAEDMDYHR